MTKVIEEIKADARALSLKLVELGKRSGLSAEQIKAIDEAESGLCFWRRVELAEMEKTFVRKTHGEIKSKDEV